MLPGKPVRQPYTNVDYIPLSGTKNFASELQMNDKKPLTTTSYAKLFNSVNYSRIDVTGAQGNGFKY
jgi:hypothetical protein